ncbi:hypothetical protein F5883DRAFT_655775 [Diaporthe sp. PMI_573]|nr:hypothetical protein F5883DRAFT_655775 [Diaporthaceae sp. PMI_573]
MAGACAPSPNTTTVLHSAFIDVTDCGCVCSVRIDGVFYPWCRGGAALAGATPQPRPVLISAGPLTGATSSLPALSSAPAPAYRGSRQQRCERYLGITSSRHHQPQSHALDWPTHRPRYNRTKEEEDLEKGVASSSRSLGAGMRLSNRHRGTEAELRRRRRGRSGLGAI